MRGYLGGYGSGALESELCEGCTGRICGKSGLGRTVLRRDLENGADPLGGEEVGVRRVSRRFKSGSLK